MQNIQSHILSENQHHISIIIDVVQRISRVTVIRLRLKFTVRIEDENKDDDFLKS